MLDLTAITSAIGTAISDVVAGGLILVGAYAAVWAVKQVKGLFSKEVSTSHSMPSYSSSPKFSVNHSRKSKYKDGIPF